MKLIFSIKKNLYSLLLSCVMAASTLLLTSCGGPSAEKIAQAQDTYSNLIAIHNRVSYRLTGRLKMIPWTKSWLHLVRRSRR